MATPPTASSPTMTDFDQFLTAHRDVLVRYFRSRLVRARRDPGLAEDLAHDVVIALRKNSNFRTKPDDERRKILFAAARNHLATIRGKAQREQAASGGDDEDDVQTVDLLPADGPTPAAEIVEAEDRLGRDRVLASLLAKLGWQQRAVVALEVYYGQSVEQIKLLLGKRSTDQIHNLRRLAKNNLKKQAQWMPRPECLGDPGELVGTATLVALGGGRSTIPMPGEVQLDAAGRAQVKFDATDAQAIGEAWAITHWLVGEQIQVSQPCKLQWTDRGPGVWSAQLEPTFGAKSAVHPGAINVATFLFRGDRLAAG